MTPPPSPSAARGRRESKKHFTRDALLASAARLFAERGYHGTTVADIATDARVSPRTFFGYFATKEAVLFSPLDELGVDLIAALDTSPDDALTTLRDWVGDHAEWFATDFKGLRATIEAVAKDNHTVAQRGLMFLERVTEGVAARLRRDLGAAPDDALPHMAAAAAVAALTVALPFGPASHGGVRDSDVAATLMRDLDEAVAFARAGLAATRPAAQG